MDARRGGAPAPAAATSPPVGPSHPASTRLKSSASDEVSMAEEPLEVQVEGTYRALRWGTAILGLALPWVLWIGGFLDGRRLMPSMSAYYHSGVRNEFVGMLCAVSALLVLYRGYTSLENWALNLAGTFLVGVALVPMDPETERVVTAHGTFAVLFFACIAYVCLFRASDTLSLLHDPSQAARFRRTYRALGLAMLASPILAAILEGVLQPGGRGRSFIFFVEAAGVYVFAAYWLVKTYEVGLTHSEALAMRGQLVSRPRRARALRGLFAERPVERVPARTGDVPGARTG